MNGLRAGYLVLAVLGAAIFLVRDASARDSEQQKAKPDYLAAPPATVVDGGEIFFGQPSADFGNPQDMRKLIQQFAAHPPAGGMLSTRHESSGVRVLDLKGMQAAGLLPKPGQLAGPGLVGQMGWLATPQGMPDHQPPDFGELNLPPMPSPDPDPEHQTYQDRIDALVAAAHRNAESHLRACAAI